MDARDCDNLEQLRDLVAAMNENNDANKHTPYSGYEITETRRKYHLLNSILTNGQRSGVFLIDRKTGDLFQSVAYGRAGRKIGTVESVLAQYRLANRQTQTAAEAF